MEIALKPEHQKILDDQLGSGRYRDTSEVVGEALELLQDRRQRAAELQRELQPALDQLDRGEYREVREDQLEDFAQEIRENTRRSLAEKSSAKFE